MKHIVSAVIEVQNLSFLQIFFSSHEHLYFLFHSLILLFGLHGTLIFSFFVATFADPGFLFFKLILELFLKLCIIGHLAFVHIHLLEGLGFGKIDFLNFSRLSFELHDLRVCSNLLKFSSSHFSNNQMIILVK